MTYETPINRFTLALICIWAGNHLISRGDEIVTALPQPVTLSFIGLYGVARVLLCIFLAMYLWGAAAVQFWRWCRAVYVDYRAETKSK